MSPIQISFWEIKGSKFSAPFFSCLCTGSKFLKGLLSPQSNSFCQSTRYSSTLARKQVYFMGDLTEKWPNFKWERHWKPDILKARRDQLNTLTYGKWLMKSQRTFIRIGKRTNWQRFKVIHPSNVARYSILNVLRQRFKNNPNIFSLTVITF